MANVQDNTMGQTDFWAQSGLPFLCVFPGENRKLGLSISVAVMSLTQALFTW